MIYDLDPREVARMIAGTRTSRAKIWLNDLARYTMRELKANSSRFDETEVMESAMRSFADEIGWPTDPEELLPNDLFDEHEVAEMWYERGHYDGTEGMEPNPESYPDYPE